MIKYNPCERKRKKMTNYNKTEKGNPAWNCLMAKRTAIMKKTKELEQSVT